MAIEKLCMFNVYSLISSEQHGFLTTYLIVREIEKSNDSGSLLDEACIHVCAIHKKKSKDGKHFREKRHKEPNICHISFKVPSNRYKFDIGVRDVG